MEQLEEVLDEDTFNRYKLVFDMSIDLLKFISHDPTMLHGLVVKQFLVTKTY